MSGPVGSKETGEVCIVDPKTGGMKGSKPERFDLIPWAAMEEVARVYHFGTTKGYDANNWRKGYAWSLSIAALFRHIVEFVLGKKTDAESKLHPLAHAAFHIFTLMTFDWECLGTDDRVSAALPPTPKARPTGFKVGDKVKVVLEYSSFCGDTGTIQKVTDDWKQPYLVSTSKGGLGHFAALELEPA